MKNTSQILMLGTLLSLPVAGHAVTLEDCRTEQQEHMSQCTADEKSVEVCKEELEQQMGLANVSIDLEDARKAINGSKRRRENDEEVLASFNQTPPYPLDPRFRPSVYRHYIARHSLHICFSTRRYAEMSSGAVPPEEKRCSTEAARAVNQELADIEGRITNFLISPAATTPAGATPTLRVVMWATQRGIDAIARHCPEGELFIEKESGYKAAYDKALEACRTLLREPERCGPAAPDEL
jgi:hypothetical protein